MHESEVNPPLTPPRRGSRKFLTPFQRYRTEVRTQRLEVVFETEIYTTFQ
ncbi:MAG: hypothetical protein AB4063_10615 [Crocosphaera sp.]